MLPPRARSTSDETAAVYGAPAGTVASTRYTRRILSVGTHSPRQIGWPGARRRCDGESAALVRIFSVGDLTAVKWQPTPVPPTQGSWPRGRPLGGPNGIVLQRKSPDHRVEIVAPSRPCCGVGRDWPPMAWRGSRPNRLARQRNVPRRSERLLSVSEILTGWRSDPRCIGPSSGLPWSGSHGGTQKSMTATGRVCRIQRSPIRVKSSTICADSAGPTFRGGFCRLMCATR